MKRKDEIILESGDQLYDFVVLRDMNGDGGEVLASLRTPEHPNQVFVPTKRFPQGELCMHCTFAFSHERLAAIDALFDQHAKKQGLC